MKKKYKILLVNPWVTDFSLYDFWVKPLGLLIIGSILKKEGFEIYLLDLLDRHNPFLIEHLSEKERRKIRDKKFSTGKFLSREIKKPEIYKNIKRKYRIYGWYPEIAKKYLKNVGKIDFILVTSGMTYWYPGIIETIKFLKKIYPDSTYILGGRYVFLCQAHAEKTFEDIYLIPEIKISEILKKLGSIIREGIEYSSISFDLYFDYPVLRHFALITSFGCPFKCVYCASNILFPEFKTFDNDYVIELIERVYNSKFPLDFAFYDDALLYPPERAKELLRKIIEKKFNLRIHVPNAIHARYIDEEMAMLLKKANFKTIRIGLETIDEEKLNKEWSKKINLEIFERAIFNLRKAGFEEIGVYVLIGTKNDTPDSILRTYEYLYKKRIRIYPAQFSPVPGTCFFGKNKDPLLTNKSIYPLGNPEIGFENYEKLKNFAKILNRNLDSSYPFKELLKFLYK